MRNRFIVLASLLALGPVPVSGHVTLDEPQAKAGSYHVAFFRVSHGCDGSPTIALRIAIPEGIAIARPQPKPGWTLEKEHAPLAIPVKSEMGETVTTRVSAVVWHGRLEADEFDQFGLLLKLPATPGPLAFPVTQTCEKGEAQWTEVPQPGQSPHGMKNPAPVLTLTPAMGDNAMPGMDMSGTH